MINQIKAIVEGTMKTSMPMQLLTATVLSNPPDLSIQILTDTPMVIPAELLIVSEHLLPYTQLYVIEKQEYRTDDSSPYEPKFSSKGEIDFTRSLEIGDVVLVLRLQGGQQYYILDRGVSFGTNT